MSEPPNILKAMKTLRELRGWSFEKVRDYTIEEYRRRVWAIPPSIEAMYARDRAPGPGAAKAGAR